PSSVQLPNGALSAANLQVAQANLAEYLKAGASGANGQDWAKHCFLAIILPYVEQGNVLRINNTAYDFHKDWYDVANVPASLTRIPIYECPSCTFGHIVNPPLEPATYGQIMPATTDYMAVNRSNNRAAIWTAMGLTY